MEPIRLGSVMFGLTRIGFKIDLDKSVFFLHLHAPYQSKPSAKEGMCDF